MYYEIEIWYKQNWLVHARESATTPLWLNVGQNFLGSGVQFFEKVTHIFDPPMR